MEQFSTFTIITWNTFDTAVQKCHQYKRELPFAAWRTELDVYQPDIPRAGIMILRDLSGVPF